MNRQKTISRAVIYARCSTDEKRQDVENQLKELFHAPSGVTHARKADKNRPLLSFSRPPETFFHIVTNSTTSSGTVRLLLQSVQILLRWSYITYLSTMSYV